MLVLVVAVVLVGTVQVVVLIGTVQVVVLVGTVQVVVLVGTVQVVVLVTAEGVLVCVVKTDVRRVVVAGTGSEVRTGIMTENTLGEVPILSNLSVVTKLLVLGVNVVVGIKVVVGMSPSSFKVVSTVTTSSNIEVSVGLSDVSLFVVDGGTKETGSDCIGKVVSEIIEVTSPF